MGVSFLCSRVSLRWAVYFSELKMSGGGGSGNVDSGVFLGASIVKVAVVDNLYGGIVDWALLKGDDAVSFPD